MGVPSSEWRVLTLLISQSGRVSCNYAVGDICLIKTQQIENL